ncbi:membrane protein [soil metagenome]
MYRLKYSILLFFFASIQSVFAQTGNSPYSIRGIGDIQNPALIHNIGMGGVGLSQPQNLFLNNMNPALLPFNNFTVLAIGLSADVKTIYNENTSTRSIGGGLSYFALGFPVMENRWGMSLGLRPYSFVNYDYQTNGTVPGTETNAVYEYSGEGGISQFYISNGFLLSKNFSAGLQIGYLFGAIINETGTALVNPELAGPSNTVLYERTNFSDFSFKAGLNYNARLRSRTFFSAGLIYELEGEKNARHFISLQRRSLNNAQVSVSDTIVNNERGGVRLPSTIGLGVSLYKTYKWTIASDVTYSNWSAYRSFNGTTSELSDSYKIALGGEYTPNVNSLDNYLSRITYRTGINFENTPYQVNLEQVRDFGINFGVSLPVSRLSSLDLAFILGQRGTTDNQLLRENYFRVHFGVTLNDKWFVRRKFD